MDIKGFLLIYSTDFVFSLHFLVSVCLTWSLFRFGIYVMSLSPSSARDNFYYFSCVNFPDSMSFMEVEAWKTRDQSLVLFGDNVGKFVLQQQAYRWEDRAAERQMKAKEKRMEAEAEERRMRAEAKIEDRKMEVKKRMMNMEADERRSKIGAEKRKTEADKWKMESEERKIKIEADKEVGLSRIAAQETYVKACQKDTVNKPRLPQYKDEEDIAPLMDPFSRGSLAFSGWIILIMSST